MIVWSNKSNEVGSLLFLADPQLLKIEPLRVVWSLREAMRKQAKNDGEVYQELRRAAKIKQIGRCAA